MVGKLRSTYLLAFSLLLTLAAWAPAQGELGGVSGFLRDNQWDQPAADIEVKIAQTGQKATSDANGRYVLQNIKPGVYTLIFSGPGFRQAVKPDVNIRARDMADVSLSLEPEIDELETVIVEEQEELDPGGELQLLELRKESPSLVDSIGADLISRAGAGNAAEAAGQIAGVAVQGGKTVVIRGLPDRYISSQLNGVRLPTADADKRAVELDQFPSAVIESIQVEKTFTPSQQGDASGGVVDIILKSIPKEPWFLKYSSQVSYNTQVTGKDNFLSSKDGGLDFFGGSPSSRDIQAIDQSWTGSVGVSREGAPIDYKWALSGGGSHEFRNGLRVGGFVSLFYERDSSFNEDGIDDSRWITTPGGGTLTPQQFQIDGNDDFKTRLFDVERASREVQFGGLGAFGVETENHRVNMSYLFSRSAEDLAILSEDTRGKQEFYPGYDPADPNSPGFEDNRAAPYSRFETLSYTLRTTTSLQFAGEHTLPTKTWGVRDILEFKGPTLDWKVAFSSADSDQPDKRQFGSEWEPGRETPFFTFPPTFFPLLPAANINLGNLQRIFTEITEESEQYAANVKLPFEQWTDTKGYFQLGYFKDSVDRTFDQDSFTNSMDFSTFTGEFNELWSAVFPFETQPHPIAASEFDVDYEATQDIEAYYLMLDLPLTSRIKLVGGVRWESTDITLTNDPESRATWLPPGTNAITTLNPGDADVAFSQEDVLPSIGLDWRPTDELTFRAAYNKTIARQTFKELTPILQQEFLGGPIFIGNPGLQMSAVQNYDLRLDYRPTQGSLFSVSAFRKDIKNAIEYVQALEGSTAAFNFTTPINYPEGTLKGLEFEIRQELGELTSALEGLAIGANATFLDARVTLPDEEQAVFNRPNLMVPISERDMTNAPDQLFNFYLTYDVPDFGTQLGIFYTITGDTLLVGAGEAGGNFVPSTYAKQFGTLNLSLTQRIGEVIRLKVQAKNLTNPDIDTVYRSEYLDGGDVLRTSRSRGVEFSISISGEIRF